MQRISRSIGAVAAVSVLVLTGAACGSDDTTDDTTTTEAASDAGSNSGSDTGLSDEALANLEEIEARGKPEMSPAPIPETLVITDDVEGTGAEVQPGDAVTVHYVGVAATSGEEFDSSWERGEPITFGLDQVIQGWGEGLVGMKEGGRRTLVIPAELGYGNSGPAPGDALVFTVDLVAVS